MKRILILILAVCFLTACDTSIHVTNVLLSESSIHLVTGDSFTLRCTIEPVDATNKEVEWWSNTPSIASVNNGVVTAGEHGTTRVNVRSADGLFTASCEVTVSRKAIERIVFDPSEVVVRAGDSTEVKIKVIPEDALLPGMELRWDTYDSGDFLELPDGSIIYDYRYAHARGDNTKGVVRGDRVGESRIEVNLWYNGMRQNDFNYVPIDAHTCPVKVLFRIPEPVDLGLSVNWASFPLGLTSEIDALGGVFFRWGVVSKTESYNSKYDYPYLISGDPWLGVQDSLISIGTIICGTEYDAAHVNLGDGWRMPRKVELQELAEMCSWERIRIDDDAFYKATGPNGKSLLFDCRSGGFIIWSGELSDNPEQAYALCTSYEDIPPVVLITSEIWNSLLIRPVKAK